MIGGMTRMIGSPRRAATGVRVLAAAVGVIAASALVACGSDESAGPAAGSAGVAEQPGAGTVETTDRTDRLDLTLTGAVAGRLTEIVDPPTCTWRPNDLVGEGYVYSVEFDSELDGLPARFSVLQNVAAAGTETYAVDDVNIWLVLDEDRKYTSSFSADSDLLDGSVTIDKDHSGSIEATLGPSGDLEGPPVTIRGDWDCAEFAGPKSS